MQALIRAHLHNSLLTSKELLQIAHRAKYKCDTLDRVYELQAYELDRYGTIPPYLADYMVSLFGEAV
jgi:hypothetical protein